jgi:hypothetical protein
MKGKMALQFIIHRSALIISSKPFLVVLRNDSVIPGYTPGLVSLRLSFSENNYGNVLWA